MTGIDSASCKTTAELTTVIRQYNFKLTDDNDNANDDNDDGSEAFKGHCIPEITSKLECGPMPNVKASGHPAEYRWRPLFNATVYRFWATVCKTVRPMLSPYV